MPFASCPSKVTPRKRSAIDQALATPGCARKSSAKRRTSRSTTGSSRSPRRLTKNIGAALHCRVPTRSRGESTAISSARAAEIQSTGRKNRGRAALTPPGAVSGDRRPASAIAAAPSAARAPASRTPATGTRMNGAAAAAAAASAREIRRRPSGKRARRAATITKNAQRAANPSGRKRARCRLGLGQSGRASRPAGDGSTPRPDSVSALASCGSTPLKSGASPESAPGGRSRSGTSRAHRPGGRSSCRAASPSLSLCPRARTGRALGFPLGRP